MKPFNIFVFQFFLLTSIFISSCSSSKNLTIDKKATKETRALFKNLKKLSENHTLFGHQHATEYGHGWYGPAEDKSDVKMVVGSHPAVIGIDFSGFTNRNEEARTAYKSNVRKVTIDAYNRGGVITAAWHFPNPISGRSFNWVRGDTVTVADKLIPGGTHHAKYNEILDGIAEWALTLKGKNGNLVPIIFRPYHEFDGGWFWWGKPHVSKENFITLWRYTVSYLRDKKGVHNFLYAFSPDNKFRTLDQFLERYPGDDYVDMVGMDNYGDMGRDRYTIDTAVMKLKILSDYAIKTNKLAAFTETGLESIPNTTWWTGTLLKTMKTYHMQLCYVLVWRNDARSATHYYAPYPGQVSASDFKAFFDDPYTLFEKDLDGVYR
jgi:mannan endo-1,4-beta-mannosidase